MKLADYTWLKKEDAATLLGISVSTLNRLRKSPDRSGWQSDLQFTRRDNGQYVYNQQLLLAWRDRRITPHAYNNALQEYLQAVEVANKPKRSSLQILQTTQPRK